MKLLTCEEVAALLRLPSVHALHQLRYRGSAPPAVKVGSKLLFREDHLTAWLDRRAREQAR